MRTFAACFALLAILAAPGALAQQAADTIVTRGEIRRIKPTMTMVGGRVVFEDGRRWGP
jgi:hypothetical protein